MKKTIAPLFLLILWFVLTEGINTPLYIFAGPLATFKAFYTHFALLMSHLSITAGTMIAGYFLGAFLGLALGTLMALSPSFKKILMPMVFFKQGLPSFVLAPLIILGFGIGIASKLIITALTVFFIVLYSAQEALCQTPPHLLHMARMMEGKKALIFYHLRFKWMLPSLKTALKTAAVMAPAATIAGEWVGSTQGLGFIILHAFDRVQNDLMIAALLLCIALGGLFSFCLSRFLNNLIFWRYQ